MGSDRLEVFRITDFMTALIILENPIIARDIHEDGVNKEFPDVVNEFWIGVSDYGFTFACFRVHQMGRAVWQIHARVLPNYRSKFGEKAAHLALEWAFAYIPDIEVIVCLVPQCFRNVDLFVRRIGFKKVGLLERSYLRDGKLEDMKLYQIRGVKCQQD